METDKWYRVHIKVVLSVYIAYIFEETDAKMEIVDPTKGFKWTIRLED